MAEHSTDLGHRILLNRDCLKREAKEIKLHPSSMTREEGFSLSRSWKPLIHSLKERKKVFSKDKIITSS
jgi:hypothetical protein